MSTARSTVSFYRVHGLMLLVEEHVREGESDRYAVVYCGATDAVGLSLRETCTKLGVQFSWESFGS
eukprot:11234-Heterococcus_DN1.PRE.1